MQLKNFKNLGSQQILKFAFLVKKNIFKFGGCLMDWVGCCCWYWRMILGIS
jgi:hypothetical protein